MENISIFEYMYPDFKIKKPIRLIELFAGVGSQAMALRNIRAEFEHHRVVEFDKYAIASYNAIHSTEFEPMDITKITGEDLGITDTKDYCYILTYSFPCQDLSVAGNQKGMAKGSGTRSGLLWEVERLLEELDELPQVLLMENVPQVIATANIKDFNKWQAFLQSKGYTNYTDTLNAKHYGVAQNRNRTFMVSVLGQYNYKFPKPIPLEKTMKDYLEDDVDEKYYINNDKARKLIEELERSGQLPKAEDGRINVVGSLNPEKNVQKSVEVYAADGVSPTLTATDYKHPMKICVDGTINSPKAKEISNCIKARYDSGISNQRSEGGLVIEKIKQIGNLSVGSKIDNPQTGRIYDDSGLSPILNCMQGGNRQPMIVASRGRNPNSPSDRTAGAHVEQRLEPNSEGICNTLTTVQKDNMVLEHSVKIKQATKSGYADCKIGGVADMSFPNSNTRRGRVQDRGDICPTLMAAETEICKIESLYRIRKLTPLECWRLMGFSDEDFYKASEVNSNSQLYKQAGNSIVVNVLEAIFKQMF